MKSRTKMMRKRSFRRPWGTSAWTRCKQASPRTDPSCRRGRMVLGVAWPCTCPVSGAVGAKVPGATQSSVKKHAAPSTRGRGELVLCVTPGCPIEELGRNACFVQYVWALIMVGSWHAFWLWPDLGGCA